MTNAATVDSPPAEAPEAKHKKSTPAPEARSAAEIKADIDEAQLRLASNVDELSERISPEQLAAGGGPEVKDDLHQRGRVSEAQADCDRRWQRCGLGCSARDLPPLTRSTDPGAPFATTLKHHASRRFEVTHSAAARPRARAGRGRLKANVGRVAAS